MKIVWEFKINGTPVEEPIGWDALTITLQRDIVYQGLENIFSDNITFWDTGAQIIKTEYELNGIDADLTFTSRYSCDGGLTFTEAINGILNAFFYSIENNIVTIKIEPSGFHRKVKNRLSTHVNLNSNISIGGLPMSTINPFDLGLHSKTILEQGIFTYGPQIDIPNTIPGYTLIGELAQTFNVSFDLSFLRTIERSYSQTMVPEVIVTSEIETYNEGIINTLVNSTSYPGDNLQLQPPVFYNIANISASSFNFSGPIHFAYQLTLNLVVPPTVPRNLDVHITAITFYMKAGGTVYTIGTATDITISVTLTSAIPSYNLALQNTAFNIFEPNISLINPDEVKLYIKYDVKYELQTPLIITEPDYSVEIINRGYINDLDYTGIDKSKVTVESYSKQPPSTTKAFLIHEVFAKLSESMTDEIDSFRSDFFGRLNSSPHSYDNDGCGGWTAITNGINLRKMLDKAGNLFPIVTTFQDLFASADAVWNLGMKIEKDETGKEYIRVEPKSFFYNSTSILNCFNISDLKKTPAQDLIFNNFKIGYEKWNLNVTGSNALDEFNSVHNYSVPVRNASKTLISLSKYIGSGYIVEQSRRLQFKAVPTNDFEVDNNMFFICTNRNTVESDLYTNPAISTSYAAGTVSERDENFTGILHIIDPTTPYNLRISPTRNAEYWYNYISASIFKIPAAPIKFINGEGNFQELDTIINDCIISSSVVQNQDLNATDLMGLNAVPIYLPEYLEYSYPMSFQDFINVMNNSEKSIQISCSDTLQYTGFIKSLKFTPNAQGGEADFLLIRGNCLQGDFNNDFNNDFFIGTC